MEWQGDGLVLNVRRHGETSAIIDVLTRERGRHSGLVRGGRSRNQRPVLQAGNLVHLVWRARLEDHLGQFTADPHKMIVANIIDNLPRLAAVSSITTLASLLPEREPHPRLYDASLLLLEHLENDDVWPALLVRWELGFLNELGFGLDLTACAVSGEREGLAYVSPKTGRAVTATQGEPWKDKLLALPRFICEPSAPASPQDIHNGLALTEAFLRRHVFEPREIAPPEGRARVMKWLAKQQRA